MVQNENSQCLLNREFPEFLKTQPTFISRSNFKASRTLKPKKSNRRGLLSGAVVALLTHGIVFYLCWCFFLTQLQLTAKKVLYWELLITVQVHLSEFVWGIRVKGYWLSSNQKTAMRFNWPITIKDCWPGLQELVCPLLKINKLHNFNCNTNHRWGDTTEPWNI